MGVSVLHYDSCHPGRWRLEPPTQSNTFTILGLVLTGVGPACTATGFILMMF